MTLRDDEVGRTLAPHVEPGMTVLDVGAGTGKISRWLAARRGIRPTLADVTEFGNRVTDLPFIPLDRSGTVPAPDDSFDAVMLLFVLHHIPRWEDQERLIGEAARIARRRILILEDTPTSRIDRAFNVAWDWLLNLRHGVPTPFTFRGADAWEALFGIHRLSVHHRRTYRARWPTLWTYHHTLFVLEPERELADRSPGGGR